MSENLTANAIRKSIHRISIVNPRMCELTAMALDCGEITHEEAQSYLDDLDELIQGYCFASSCISVAVTGDIVRLRDFPAEPQKRVRILKAFWVTIVDALEVDGDLAVASEKGVEAAKEVWYG